MIGKIRGRVKRYFDNGFRGNGYFVRLSDAQLRHRLLGRVSLLAGKNGTGIIFDQCRICWKFKYHDDPKSGPWLREEKLKPLRQRIRHIFPELAKKFQHFPMEGWEFCDSCFEKEGKK